MNEVITDIGASSVIMESQRPQNLPVFIQEIDNYLGQTFDAMTVIDQSFGKFSNFFLEQANEVLGDRDFDKLSKKEQEETFTFLAAALAIDGACAIVKGIKKTVELEKVKRLHLEVAKSRHESLPRMIERTRRCHDEAASLLLRHKGRPFNMGVLQESFKQTADMLENELCQYRDLRFRLDMLLWLKDEYEAWLDGRLYSDTPMPTMGQATIAAIYLLAGKGVSVEDSQPPVGIERRRSDLKSFGEELARDLDSSNFPNGKDFISAFEILAIIDSQLGSVLEHANLEKNPLTPDNGTEDEIDLDIDEITCKRLYAQIYLNAGHGSEVKRNLSESRLTLRSMKSYESFLNMKKDYENGCTRTFVNVFLISAAAIIPVWTLGWAWYWQLILTLVILAAVKGFVAGPSLRGLMNRFLDKFEMMSCNYEYKTAEWAGLIEPKSKVKEMAESRNHFWAGLIIGGLIGLIGGPLGMIIGAIIGAVIGSGSSGDYDKHGEGWESIRISRPVKQWTTSIILICALLAEIYFLFIND